MKNRIRELREASGMTMKELGSMIGFAESTISQYETGKRNPSGGTLLNLGECFGVSVEYLLCAETDPSFHNDDEFQQPNNSILAINLRKHRKLLGLSQKALADIISVNQTAVSQWERGATLPSTSVLMKLSSFYGISLDLLTGNDSISRPAPSEQNNRLKDLRIERGLFQKDIADHLGIDRTTYAKYESGASEPNHEMLMKLADFYKVSVDYLLGLTDLRSSSNIIRIPVLGSIPAGIPVEAVEEIIGWEEIPADWGRGDKEYFALKVKGDSMYPKYLNGDTVILRKQNTCDSGDDCAVMVNGYEGTLKQVILHEDGSLEIRPCNTAYNPRTFTPDEIRALPVSIAGVVVELRRKIK